MNITVTGRHVDITESMREYAKEKIQKIEKFSPGLIIDSHIIMDVEKHRQNVEVNIKGKTFFIHAHEETGDMYSSIDILISKVEKKLRSIKEKLQNHHRKSTKEAETILHVIPKSESSSDEDKTITIRSEKLDGKPLFLEDAIIKLQESHDAFLVFLNAETDKINVIHKINQNEMGVIEPN